MTAPSEDLKALWIIIMVFCIVTLVKQDQQAGIDFSQKWLKRRNKNVSGGLSSILIPGMSGGREVDGGKTIIISINTYK